MDRSPVTPVVPAPSAAQELGRKIQLGLETKRLIAQIEKEVEDLDWQVTDQLGTVPRLAGPAIHLLSAGGKRVRPLLVCLLARALGTPFERVAPCAVAAELVHTATLLHDDVLDGATTRRGRITAHLKYDAHTAILSGDALLAKAIVDMAELRDPEVLQRLGQTVRELVEGECLQADLSGKVHADLDTVIEIARRKTASLFAWSAWVAGYRAGRHADDLFKFGNHLGIAFQLLDDVLDWEGKDTGKDLYQDLHETKLNSLAVALVQRSRRAQALLEESFRGGGCIPDPAALGEQLRACDEYPEALRFIRGEAMRHSSFALAHLDALPASEWKDLARHLTDNLLRRMS
ncbi:MAG: polyprenyl synthetase family protein [Bdellovibrionales bacterium]|nr:polyprenyl synthetase family protein [Bdellovibrionales bacterium]